MSERARGWSYTTEATSNRLSSIGNPTRSFSYDPAGNTLTDTGLGYTTTFRLDNRINSLTKAGVSSYYSYDAGGQPIRKMTDSTTSPLRLRFAIGRRV